MPTKKRSYFASFSPFAPHAAAGDCFAPPLPALVSEPPFVSDETNVAMQGDLGVAEALLLEVRHGAAGEAV